jgi:acetyl esterase
MLKRLLVGTIVALVLIAGGVYAAFQWSPWPSVWLIRYAFGKGGADAAASIIGLIPKGVSVRRGINYAQGNPSALLDVFAPDDAQGHLPVVIWVHGGGFVAGSRAELSGYLQVLAKRGFVVVAIDYTLAPEAQFPTPLRETNAALAFVLAHADEYKIDPHRVFLAGDSAGAQIAAQTALIISDPSYARHIGLSPGMSRDALHGVVLFCGPYDPSELNWSGSFAGFMRTVIWSYVGTRDPHDSRVAQIAVAPHVTRDYPPTFISAGNADPLASQSYTLAKALRAQGVEVDDLFFPADHEPPLGHEYQLLLTTHDGHLSFERFMAFLSAHDAAAPVAISTP